jgi:hypothetical protein
MRGAWFSFWMFAAAGLVIPVLISASVLWASVPPSDGLMLVIVLPWSDSAETVVARAGGWVVGMEQAPLSVMATGTTASALRAAGAWAVLSAEIPSFLCLQGANP